MMSWVIHGSERCLIRISLRGVTESNICKNCTEVETMQALSTPSQETTSDQSILHNSLTKDSLSRLFIL